MQTNPRTKRGRSTDPPRAFCTPTARSRTVTVLRLRHQVIALQSDNQHRSLVNSTSPAPMTLNGRAGCARRAPAALCALRRPFFRWWGKCFILLIPRGIAPRLTRSKADSFYIETCAADPQPIRGEGVAHRGRRECDHIQSLIQRAL